MLNRYLFTRKLFICFVASCLLSLAVATVQRPLQRVDRFAEAMGTTFSISAYVSDAALYEEAIEASLNEARRIDRMLSNYKPESELSQVNLHAAESPVRVSRELFQLLRMCLDVSRESDGAFDVTVGPLMKLWGFYLAGAAHVPDAQAVTKVLDHVGFRLVILDAEQQTVRFTKPGVELDPGGVGKGYAVDRMAAILIQRGIHSALLSAGGSSIYGIGSPPDDSRGWRIEIQDPLDSGRHAGSLYLKNNSLSTSGGYEKFFQYEGRKYSHLMDPRTGYPVTGMLSVSVVCPRTLDSEVWAKPFYVLGREWTERHLQPGFRVFLCQGSETETCSWIEARRNQ